MARKTRNHAHYINNVTFSNAVIEYVEKVNNAQKLGNEPPIVPDYIAQCFLNIAEGLSHKSNFIRYTYREEMVMDAVENCLKAINNYDIEVATRTGKPNAFAYFTQISWYAFLRRIEKEKRQQDIKTKYIAESGVEAFADTDDGAPANLTHFVDQLKDRIDRVKEYDTELKAYQQSQKQIGARRKRTIHADSDLVEFLV